MKTMVTLLSAELAAGAFGRDLASISGSAAANEQNGQDSTLSATAGTGGKSVLDRSALDSKSIEIIHQRFMNDNSFATLIDGCLTSLDFKETNYNVDEANAGRPAGNSKKPFAEHPIFAIEKDDRHCYPQNVKFVR